MRDVAVHDVVGLFFETSVMSLRINALCVNCDVCEPVCPNRAISMGETIYIIDPLRCTECVGHYDEPQCVVVCPVECIDPDPGLLETREQLLSKLQQLQRNDPELYEKESPDL
ncbi:ferredoxin [Xylella fastidiosa subsp. fastidiosa Mus-1]|nr:ferredoxin [Xylella fastidiosa MUL0034]KAF0571848.1 ferredoxin [Xylella fastidiosa subsp. fastidiosa Mus-1]